MSDIEEARQALVTRILEGPGHASLSERRAAFDNRDNPDLAAPLDALVHKVVAHAYRVTDEEIAIAKRVGFSEDKIFEIMVCAAVGQASRQHDAALAALEAAYKKD